MKNPFSRASRDPSNDPEALAAARREREREENERFMQQLYANPGAHDPRSRALEAGAPVHGTAGFEHSIGEPTGPQRASRDPALRDPALRDAAMRDAAMRDAALREPALRDPVPRDAALRDPGLRDPGLRDPAPPEPVASADPTIARSMRPGAGAAAARAAASAPTVPTTAPPAAPTQKPAPATPEAAVELLDVAHRLLEGREDTESRVAKMLIGRALDLMRGRTPPPV